MKTSIFSSGLIMAAVLLGCSTNPETGRRQLSLVSSDQEMKLGLTSFEQMKKEVPISHDPAANALVQKVGKRIAGVANLPNAQWEFVVFESKEANAFCLPGGKVGIYTGILPLTRDEAGLATVIGHEVAHAVSHHGAERMSQATLLNLGGEAVGALTQNSKPVTQTAVAAVYGLGGQVGYMLPHSRSQESEADHIGLLYMARAGYDPEAAVQFWQRFSDFNKSHGGSGTPNFLRTHPVDDVRIKQLQQWIPEARAQAKGGPASSRGSDVIGR